MLLNCENMALSKKVIDFYERNHKAKCTAHYKHTTSVYTSFFKTQSDMRWTWKKEQRALANDLLRKTIISSRVLQRLVLELAIVVLRVWQKKPPIKSALVATSTQHMCTHRSFCHNVNCIGQLSLPSAVHHSCTWSLIQSQLQSVSSKSYFITRKP